MSGLIIARRGSSSRPFVAADIALAGLITSNVVAATNSITISKPTANGGGDLPIGTLLIAGVAKNNETVFSVIPTDWGVVPGGQDVSVSTLYRGTLFYKFLDGTEGASFTWGWAGDTSATGGIIPWANVNQASPFDVTVAPNNQVGNGDNRNNVCPTLTTVRDRSMVFRWCGTGSSESHIPPSGHVERWDIRAVAAFQVSQSLADTGAVKTPAGSVGPATFVISSTNAAIRVGHTIALRPA